jgi:hypothetical protein
MPKPFARFTLLAVVLLVQPGCVERIMRISTSPPGARVFLNDEEVGRSPARVAFTWYGDYDVVLRKEGFETQKSHYVVKPPWYQLPPFDFVTEVLLPGTIRDEHVLPTYNLSPASQPAAADLVNRAIETQERATFEGR